jgi:hypothetical protein
LNLSDQFVFIDLVKNPPAPHTDVVEEYATTALFLDLMPILAGGNQSQNRMTALKK